MKLYNHQQALVDKNPARHLLCHGCGTGKTITALALAQKNKSTALIVVPKSIKEKWGRDILEWNPSHKIVTKEEFRRDWDTYGPYKALIVDECHAFASMKSNMSKSMDKYIKKYKPKHIWLLSATPITSTPWSIYRLATFLGYPINYWTWKNKYFYSVPMMGRMIETPKAGIKDDLIDEIRRIGDVVSLDECIDLPDQIFETEYIELTSSQTKAIKNLDDSSFIARFTHHHEVEQGVKKSDGYTEDQYFDSLKTQRILSYCEENPKIAVFCRYNIQIFYLKGILEDSGFKVFVLNGDIKNRDQVVQDIDKVDKCVVLIQSDTSVGYELPSIPVIIFASLSFSYLNYTQAVGRFLRINRPKKNVYIHLIVKGGPDEAIWKCIEKREDFYIELYQKLK